MARRRNKTKLGRNDACHCGSGKKYKRCCLASDKRQKKTARHPPPVMSWADEDEFERITNSVIDLLEAGKPDAAEEQCEVLRRRWPGMIDWMDRLALVRDAQGRYAEAAELNRKAADYARTHEGFEPESIQWFEDRARQQEARTAE